MEDLKRIGQVFLIIWSILLGLITLIVGSGVLVFNVVFAITNNERIVAGSLMVWEICLITSLIAALWWVLDGN